ncbi:hypothetical protein [Acetobacter sicerae]|uniref:hypothetical protein n=1 Tax=Acetobacter sicerae TaxID=85325 RepID=UPI00156B2AB7|nr:hypothetical protein [Acetobacter sicerae]NHN93775.1 hypothetical protein [Acetobacter sicerae]
MSFISCPEVVGRIAPRVATRHAATVSARQELSRLWNATETDDEFFDAAANDILALMNLLLVSLMEREPSEEIRQAYLTSMKSTLIAMEGV